MVSGGAHDSTTNVTTTTAYDAAGNTMLQTDPLNNTTTTTYDVDNRPTEVKAVDAHGDTQSDTTTTYDDAGRTTATQVLDGQDNPTTTYTYDSAGRQKTVTAPPDTTGDASTVTTYSYDADGNVTDTTKTNDGSTIGSESTSYDALGQSTSSTTDGKTTTYSYDANGNLVSSTDPDGNVSSETTNALGELTQSEITPKGSGTPDPANTQTTTYDAAGDMLTTSESSGTTTYDYTPLGQTGSQTVKDSSGTVQTTTGYTYDVTGNVTQQTQSVGSDGAQTTSSYTYDALGRQSGMSDAARTYTYDANSNATSMAVDGPDGKLAYQSQMGWDGLNRSATVDNFVGPNAGPYDNFAYAYDQAGNVTSVTTNTTTSTYAYNEANELTDITNSAGVKTTHFAYDANHNRTAMTCYTCGDPNGLTTQYSYTNGTTNELTQIQDASGNITTFAYDSAGNLITCTLDATRSNPQVTSYTYTSAQLLASVTLPDGTVVSFTYDANGQRIATVVTPGVGASETAATTTDTYQQGHLATESDASGTLLATFTYDSSGAPVSVLVGSDPTTAPRYYYVYDGRGNVVALTDATGNAVATYAYDEFGEVTVDTEHFSNGWHNPYLYDGAEGVRYDAVTGLNWMSVRAYDPSLGRFISRDPLGRTPLFGLVTQPYVYTDNNPLSRTDPSGQRYVLAGQAGRDAPAKDTGHPASAPPTVNQATARSVQKTVIQPKVSCRTACQKQKAVAALTGWYRHQLNVLAFVLDFGSYVADAVTLGLDLSLWLVAHSPLTLIQVGADLLSAVGDQIALVKDGSIAFGWLPPSLQSFLDGVSQVVNLVNAFLNIVKAAGAVFFLLAGLQGLAKGAENAISEFAGVSARKLLESFVEGATQATLSGGVALTSYYQSEMDGLEGRSLPQLQQQCAQQKVSCD